MSAPNRYGPNRAKALIAMQIDRDGTPIGATNPAYVVLYYNGAPVSASNPLPTTGGGGGGGGVIQSGHKATVVGSQGPYAVLFSPAIAGMTTNAVIALQPGMTDANGDPMSATIQRDSISTTGFSFWLSGLPTVIGDVAFAVLSK